MSLVSLFALPSGLEITSCTTREGRLSISLLSTQPSSACPLCGTAATRIHSRYQRSLADLPCAGQPVSFQLSVRKFFCDESTCPRKIFTERLAPFVARSRAYDGTPLSVAPDAWAGDWRPTGQTRHGSHGHPDYTPHAASTHHGAAHRASWTDHRAWH